MLETYGENALATWAVGQCCFTIEYSLRVMDDIRLAVVDAFFSLPRGGAEIGGILLGRNEGRRVTITDYLPLDCEHLTGPSFVLSPNDHIRLADMLASARGNLLGTEPVGWYHSHTRSEIYLSAADLEIYQRYFPEPWQMALVLKPHTFQPTRAGFFFREADGSICAGASYREIALEPLAGRPLPDSCAAASPAEVPPRRPQFEPAGAMTAIPAQSQPENRSTAERIEVAGLSTSAEPFPPAMQLGSHSDWIQNEEDPIQRSYDATFGHSLDVPAPVRDPAAAGGRRKISRFVFIAVGWTFSIIVVFILGTSVNRGSFRQRSANALPATSNSATDSSSPASQMSSSPSLALHAERQNGDLVLNWSIESALIRAATSGVISIQDGGSKRQIALDSPQVRGGSLLYSPTSDQITMQLTVPTPAGPVTESVMVVLPKVGSPRIYRLPASRPSSASIPHPKQPSGSVALAKASKPFREPSVANVTASPGSPIPIDSPPLKLNLDPEAALAPGLVAQTAVPPPPALVARSLQPDSEQPVSQQPDSQQAASILIRYQPAIPIAKPAPVFPPEVQTLALARKVIEVKVAIDQNGTVTKAEAIPQKNVSQFLVSSALNAARSWKFQPALRNDEPVSSETLLQFVFGH